MEQNSQTETSLSKKTILESQIRECFGRVVYTHKTHEKCADLLIRRWNSIKIWQIVLSALTTGSFIAAVFGAGTIAALFGVIVSTCLLVLNAYTKNYDLGELAQKHKQAAGEIWLIREKYLSLITDLRLGIKGIGELTKERDALLDGLHNAYNGAPSTTYAAYKKAQKALQQQEDMTFTDGEIDAFLPAQLRGDG